MRAVVAAGYPAASPGGRATAATAATRWG